MVGNNISRKKEEREKKKKKKMEKGINLLVKYRPYGKRCQLEHMELIHRPMDRNRIVRARKSSN